MPAILKEIIQHDSFSFVEKSEKRYNVWQLYK